MDVEPLDTSVSRIVIIVPGHHMGHMPLDVLRHPINDFIVVHIAHTPQSPVLNIWRAFIGKHVGLKNDL
jgi:hypothetical protein